jgi:hypothetical protein
MLISALIKTEKFEKIIWLILINFLEINAIETKVK